MLPPGRRECSATISFVPTLPLDTVLEGDCVEILETFPPASVDLVFADPPYNLQLQRPLYRPNGSRVAAVDASWDQIGSFAAYDAFTRRWLAACRRVLKPTGTIWVIGTYHNIYRVGAILQDLGFWILNDIVMIKTNPMPNFRGVRFANAHETLLWAQRERGASYTFNYQTMKALNDDLQMRSDWYLPVCSGSERLRVEGRKAHPTQKPEALLYRILLASSQPGDVVLDPFFGTGTTGAVAKKLGRRWIGIEQDAAYVAMARQRIAAVAPVADVALDWPPPRERRIPFGALLEAGLLHPGDLLRFDRSDEMAMVLATGRLRWRGREGSIHQLGRLLAGGPTNGWARWLYCDPLHGWQPIDRLRQRLRQSAAAARVSFHHGAREG
ncbi:MAG: DNA methyltransferase [Chloroflexota bacterium]|nr:DNA methyltransferase [Dehalococcoidia bacterium]MDW8253067.1 DNA methyltransferase [Chloroflexota bacterium]